MKKEVKKIKEYEVEQYFCDLCGKQFSRGVCGNSMHVCSVCGKDVCGDCSVEDRYFAWGDDNAVVCKYCNEITKPFKARLEEIYEDYEIKKKQIWKEFEKEAGKNFNKHQKDLK